MIIQMVNMKSAPKNQQELGPRRAYFTWLVFPMSVILLFSIYAFFLDLSDLLQTGAAFLLMVFSLLYILKVIKKEKINYYAVTLAYLLTALLLWSLVPALLGIGRSCSSLFGAQTSCVDDHFLTVSILLFNPFSMIILGVLCLSGIVTLLIKLKKQ